MKIGYLTAGLLATAGAAQAGEVAHYSFASQELGRDYAYTIYTPDGYGERGLTYPQMYLLHGSFGNENNWVVKGGAKATLDRLIDEGRIPPAVVIMPGAESWWVDGYNENAETAFFEDLIPHIESNWDVIPEREGRAVVVAVNKWDIEENRQDKLRELKESFERLLPQLRGAPLITVSAKTGRGLDRLQAAIMRAYEVWNRRITTAQLNRWLSGMMEAHPPPAPQGKRIKLR